MIFFRLFKVLGRLPEESKEKTIKWNKLDPEINTAMPEITWEIHPTEPAPDNFNSKYGKKIKLVADTNRNVYGIQKLKYGRNRDV